jgi:uncharacterized protein (TIGR02217 family)
MTDFHEVRFPDDISKGSSGGPTRRTDIVELVSGHEKRNAAQANSKRMYDAGIGLRNVQHLHAIIEFWEARFGQLYGFRWKDWLDYKSSRGKAQPSAIDQVLGTGDGTNTVYKVYKTYGGPETAFYTRRITKLVEDSVLVALNGTETDEYLYSVNKGLIIFFSPPSAGAKITAGYEFDVPVRFNADSLMISIDAFEAGSVPAVEIRELKLQEAPVPIEAQYAVDIAAVYGLNALIDLANKLDNTVNVVYPGVLSCP